MHIAYPQRLLSEAQSLAQEAVKGGAQVTHAPEKRSEGGRWRWPAKIRELNRVRICHVYQSIATSSFLVRALFVVTAPPCPDTLQ